MSVTNNSRRRQKNADWEAAGNIQEILRKPDLFDGDYPSLTNKPTIPTITGSVTRIPKITAPNTLGASAIEDFMNRLLINGAADDGVSTVNVNGQIKASGLEVNSSRKVVVSPSGDITIKGDNGGWGLGYFIRNYSNVLLGGFGAYGSVDSLDYYYVGSPGSPNIKFHPNLNEALKPFRAPNFQSGTYVPTMTYTHTPAPTLGSTWFYHIVGDWVHVFGDVMITPQGGVSHVITFTLPVPSAFTGEEASGTIMAGAMLGFGSVYALPSGVVAAQVNNQLSMNQRYTVNFKYKII